MVLVMKAPGFSWTFVFTPFCPAKKRRGATRSPDQSNMHDPVSLWHVEPDSPPPPTPGLTGPGPSHLLSRGSGEDEGGEDRQRVLGVGWPALDGGAHGEAEERDRLRQRERLVVLLWVPAEQAWQQQHTHSEQS